MKLGTFVLGGLAGAAVVMMMRNQRMSSVTNGLGQMLREQAKNFKETAIDKGMNVKFGGNLFGSSNRSGSSGSKRGSSHSGGLEQVENMASKEPKVKHEVNEILEQNGRHQI